MDQRELAELQARIEAVRGDAMTGAELAARLQELQSIGIRIDELEKLAQRGREVCWVCSMAEQRASMQPEPVGDELWWTCSRCEQRRRNAERTGVAWPTNIGAWWLRWSAQQRADGRDETWIDAVYRSAEIILESDPTIRNFAAAVEKASATYGA